MPIMVVSEAVVTSSGAYICSCSKGPRIVDIGGGGTSFRNNNHAASAEKEVEKSASISTNSWKCMKQKGCKFYKQAPPKHLTNCANRSRYLESRNLRRYPKLITISQSFGDTHYHFMMESLVRLATLPPRLYLQKNMKVHIAHLSSPLPKSRGGGEGGGGGGQVKQAAMPNYPEWQVELLSFFGVDKRNIISGEVYGRNVLLPSFTSCGTPSRRQVLSLRNVLLNSPHVPIIPLTPRTTSSPSSKSIAGGEQQDKF
jgi:hypothetical protein